MLNDRDAWIHFAAASLTRNGTDAAALDADAMLLELQAREKKLEDGPSFVVLHQDHENRIMVEFDSDYVEVDSDSDNVMRSLRVTGSGD